MPKQTTEGFFGSGATATVPLDHGQDESLFCEQYQSQTLVRSTRAPIAQNEIPDWAKKESPRITWALSASWEDLKR
jgi:hypothetical protein